MKYLAFDRNDITFNDDLYLTMFLRGAGILVFMFKLSIDIGKSANIYFSPLYRLRYTCTKLNMLNYDLNKLCLEEGKRHPIL